MRRTFFVFLVLLCSHTASAQTLDEQLRKNRAEQFMKSVDDLMGPTDKAANKKKTQCLTAISNQKFCDCLAKNLPVEIDFVQYVSLVTATREELEYEKQSESNKALIDNTRKARDTCTVAQRKPEGVIAGNKP